MVCGEVADFSAGFLHSQFRILYCVVHLTQRGETIVIQGAVGQLKETKEFPHLMVGPIKDGKHSIEVRPPGTALAYRFKVARPWVTPAVAHYDPLDVFLID